MTRKKKTQWTPLIRCGVRVRATGDALPVVQDAREKLGFDEVWGNSRYTVHVRRQSGEMAELIHLSIHDHSRSAKHDWRDLQRIKNEICGAEEEAIELYPRESRLVDSSNEWHLWCLVGVRMPFGFDERLVSEKGDDIGAVQRPWDDDSRPKDLVYISLEMLKQGLEDK